MPDNKNQRKSLDNIFEESSTQVDTELKSYLNKKEREFVKGKSEPTPSQSFVKELKKEKKPKLKKVTFELEEDIYNEIIKLANETRLSRKYIVNKALRTILFKK